ncbi:MAG TPA: MarC family protein [Casimicrobiaceae bacterium]|nr:MarC family protein [Casimicrobiaceae bacterium]
MSLDVEAVFSAALLLLLVIDPVGNVPLVVSALVRTPPERRRRVLIRECVIAYVVLLGFMLGGRAFLELLQLSEVSLGIAGGIILFIIALRMVFRNADAIFGESTSAEPFIVPLAIPAIAGPSALASVMLLASRDPAHLAGWVVALTLAMIVTLVVLLASHRIEAVLGPRGVQAIVRLMGLVLTAVAVQMLLNGVRTFVHEIAL